MYPLLAGTIIFILLSIYGRWIGDDIDEENAATDPARERYTPYQLQEGSAIAIADWPTPAGKAQSGDTMLTP